MPKLQVTISDALSQDLRATLFALRDKRKELRISPDVLRKAWHLAKVGDLQEANDLVKSNTQPLLTLPTLVETLLREALDARAEKERKEKPLHPVGSKIRTDSGK